MRRKITKVLPTVYEDSLSYYEVLCKLIDCVKELQDTMNGDISEYIKKVLADVIFMVTYDKAEEMIIFGYDVIQGGEDIHTYSDTDNTIYITRKE